MGRCALPTRPTANSFSAHAVLFLTPAPRTPAHPPEGSHVDWFVILKHSGNTSYLYADSSDPVLATSVHSLDSKTVGAVANTLVPALSANYALYNDEVPDDGTERQKGGGGGGGTALVCSAWIALWLLPSLHCGGKRHHFASCRKPCPP